MERVKKKKRITVQSAKDKGRRLQQWACQKISELTGFEWGKDKPIESRAMGQSGSDIRMEKEVIEKFPFAIECKYQESWAVPSWIEQARSYQKQGIDWILICKRNQKPPVIIMDAHAFFEMLKKNGTGKDTEI